MSGRRRGFTQQRIDHLAVENESLRDNNEYLKNEIRELKDELRASRRSHGRRPEHHERPSATEGLIRDLIHQLDQKDAIIGGLTRDLHAIKLLRDDYAAEIRALLADVRRLNEVIRELRNNLLRERSKTDGIRRQKDDAESEAREWEDVANEMESRVVYLEEVIRQLSR